MVGFFGIGVNQLILMDSRYRGHDTCKYAASLQLCRVSLNSAGEYQAVRHTAQARIT